MGFQPTSPIRHFSLSASAAERVEGRVYNSMHSMMPFKKASDTLEKLRLPKRSPRQSSKTSLRTDTSLVTDIPNAINEDVGSNDRSVIATTAYSPVTPTIIEDEQLDWPGGHDGYTKTKLSGPADATYTSNKLEANRQLGHIHRSPTISPRTPTRPKRRPGQSFFETDTESDNEEAVVGRASSVRISRPNVIQQIPAARERSGRLYGVIQDDRSASSLSHRISEGSEPQDTSTTDDQVGPVTPAPAEVVQDVETAQQHKVTESDTAPDVAYEDTESAPDALDRSKRGGLFMNPVSSAEKRNIQRAVSAPPLPQRPPSNRRVKIKPSDLVITHGKSGTGSFRENVVVTPYPDLADKEDGLGNENNVDEKNNGAPQRSSTIKSTKFEDDRFPSPNRSEILFLDLGLAHHPSATTTLEIKIADRGAYDDEILFQQIRTAYRNRLLGVSRFPFCLIRSATYASVPPSVQYDFRTTEFMKHFHNPRIGRKRKTWVIWLRHHSRQQSPLRLDHLNFAKRPLSASLRTADRRLSMQSDSTSVFNFSFLPPLSIPRLPFFNREPSQPSSASTYRSPPSLGSEDGSGTIKVELHHEFSFWILAFFYFCIVLASVAAVVFWTVFGVPGAGPGSETTTPLAPASNYGLTWNAAAQMRVLTGLVLGLVIALLGSMVEICLIAGAYVLL